MAGAANVTGGAPVAAAQQPEWQPQPTPAPVGVAAEPSPPTAPAEAEGATTGGGERVKASPLARRIARERGVDLHVLTGTGPGGRIVKADVQAAGAATAGAVSPGAGVSAPEPRGEPGGAPPETPTLAQRVATAKGETTVVELTRTQQTIARRMAESKATIPDFALQAEIDMERACSCAPSSSASPQRRRPRTTTWSSRPVRWPCTSTPAPTAPTAMGACSCTRA